MSIISDIYGLFSTTFLDDFVNCTTIFYTALVNLFPFNKKTNV